MKSVRTMDIQTVALDGQLLRVGIWRGSNASPPLLIFNGIGANLELVQPFADALGDVEVVIFDVPGVGGSSTPLDHPGVAAVVLGDTWEQFET